MVNTQLIPLLLAAVLLIAVTIVNASIINSAPGKAVAPDYCSFDSGSCKTAFATIGASADLQELVQHQRVKATSLPILNIYLDDQSLSKLNWKRKEAMSKDRPLLLSSDSDWVPANLIARDGERSHGATATTRLAGREKTYFSDSRMRSLEFSLAENESIFGMSSFSILHPQTRGFEKEVLTNSILAKLGIVTPQLFAVEVTINDAPIGVMLVEQTINNELLKWHGYRAGAVIGLDDSQFWAQEDLNFNQADPELARLLGSSPLNHYALNDYPIRAFDKGGSAKSDGNPHSQRRAQRLLRDYLEQRAAVNEVFDIQLLARWFIAANVFQATNGLKPHNWKFYFNPITDRLQPTSYGNLSPPDEANGLTTNDILDELSTDETFQRAIARSLKILEQTIVGASFKSNYESSRQRWGEIFGVRLDPSTAHASLLSRIQRLKSEIAAWTTISQTETLSPPQMRPKQTSKFLELGAPVHTHLTAFILENRSGSILSIKSLMSDEIVIDRIYAKTLEKEMTIARNINLAKNLGDGSLDHYYTRQLKPEESGEAAKIVVEYRFAGKNYKHQAILQFTNYKRRLVSMFPQNLADISKKIVVREDLKMVIFGEGAYSISTTIDFPPSWSLILLPGSRIELVDGALIRVRGPIYSLGLRDRPITIQISSQSEDDASGNWGGILIEQSPRKSKFHHTNFVGANMPIAAWNQDVNGLTGCITVYESAIEIRESRFDALQCSSSLNIYRSEFKLEDTSFFMSQGNSLELESSRGSISRTRFEGAKKDGLRLEASYAQMADSTFFGISNTAISINRRSELKSSDLSIESTTKAVSSTNGSDVFINGARFMDILEVAFAAAESRGNGGQSSIDCIDCQLVNVPAVADSSESSRIVLNGNEFVHDVEATLN